MQGTSSLRGGFIRSMCAVCIINARDRQIFIRSVSADSIINAREKKHACRFYYYCKGQKASGDFIRSMHGDSIQLTLRTRSMRADFIINAKDKKHPCTFYN